MSEKKPVFLYVDDGYQEMEFWYSLLRLREDGDPAEVVGQEEDRTYHSRLGYPVVPDRALASASIDACSGVIVAVGAAGAEADSLTSWLREAIRAKKPVGLTAQSAWLLESVDIVGKSSLTEGVQSFADGKLVVARTAEDLPAFYKCMSHALS